MLRGLLSLTLFLVLPGCGNDADVAELKGYVAQLQKLRPLTERVEQTITRFEDPTSQISGADIAAARQSIEEYAAAVNAITYPSESALRDIHGVYVRSFEDARRLALDGTGDTRSQAHSVASGLRKLRRDVEDRVYPSVDVLLARVHLEGGEYELNWPQRD